jgi:hypothetical protein
VGNNGLQIPAGPDVSNNRVTHNNFDLGSGVNASITMSDSTNIDITNNRLHGGTYNIYFEGNTTGCDVTNNVFAAYQFGEVAGESYSSQAYSGNISGDTAGGGSTDSATRTDTSPALIVTVDTVAPTAPTIATPPSNANGGLNLTGTAEANSVLKVYDGTTQIGTATANGSGTWSYAIDTLAAGSHSLTARATDAAGNTSSASAVASIETGASPGPTPPPTPPTEPDPTPGNPSSGSGFPDASTTGVPDGTALTSVNGNFHSSYAGQIIDAHDVEGTIIVDHEGVIIRNSKAQYIYVNADNATIEDTTVVGHNMGGSGINLLADNATVQRVDISGVDNGIWLEGSGSVVTDNYIHNVGNNGLTIPGGPGASNNQITHNNFDLGPAVNASISMADADNIDIANNRLHGGTYNIYFEGKTTGSDVTNNVFAGHVFGEVAGTAEAAQTYSGNTSGETAVNTTSSAVLGTSRDDRLTSTSGEDLLRGNGGHDTFVFAANFGRDVITDFGAGRRGHDVVQFSRTTFDDFADVLAHATQHGQDIVIDAGGGNALTLKNTALSSLDRTDFHFT